MTTSPTITYTLEEFLMRFEMKIDRQFADLKQEIVEVKNELKEVKNELKEVKREVSNLSGDVKALDERVKGIDKRLENLEFIVRGGLVAFLTAFIGLILKVAGIIPNIKAI